MGLAKPKVTWRTVALPLIGVAAFIAYLYFFQVDIIEVVAKIGTTDPFLYLLAALLTFVSTFLHAAAWRSLLSPLSVKLSITKAYLYVWYGVFVDLIIPAESVSGEVSMAYLVTREHGNHATGKAIASLVAHRLINMSMTLVVLFAGLCLISVKVDLNNLVFDLSLMSMGSTAFFLVLLLLFSARKDWTLNIADRLLRIAERLTKGRWGLARFRGEVVRAAEVFHDSLRMLRRAPKATALSIFLSALSWLSHLAVPYTVFLAMGFPASLNLWGIVLVAQVVMIAVKSIPLAVPFEVGLPEITLTTLYTILGLPMDASATATILSRLLTVWLRFFVGFVVHEWLEIKMARASSGERSKGLEGQSPKLFQTSCPAPGASN